MIIFSGKIGKKRVSYYTGIIHRNKNQHIFTVFKNRLEPKSKFEKTNTSVAKAKNGN